MFLQFFKNPSNNINVGLAWIFGINKDVIQINNDKDIEFSGWDLDDIAIKTS